MRNKNFSRRPLSSEEIVDSLLLSKTWNLFIDGNASNGTSGLSGLSGLRVLFLEFCIDSRPWNEEFIQLRPGESLADFVPLTHVFSRLKDLHLRDIRISVSEMRHNVRRAGGKELQDLLRNRLLGSKGEAGDEQSVSG